MSILMTPILSAIAILTLASIGPVLAQEDPSSEQPLTRNVPIPHFQNRAEDAKPYNDDAPPAGMFYFIKLAENVEYELGARQSHEIVPVNEKEVFGSDQAVFVVFKMYPHFESYQVMGRCFPEQAEGLDIDKPLVEDSMYVALEDDTGYLKLVPPDGHWRRGRYKVEIHVGWRVSDFSLLGTMRFSVTPLSEMSVTQST